LTIAQKANHHFDDRIMNPPPTSFEARNLSTTNLAVLSESGLFPRFYGPQTSQGQNFLRIYECRLSSNGSIRWKISPSVSPEASLAGHKADLRSLVRGGG
jgi:hypothetical protein